MNWNEKKNCFEFYTKALKCETVSGNMIDKSVNFTKIALCSFMQKST